MISLNTLGISLSTVLYEKEDFEYFMRVFNEAVLKVISDEYDPQLQGENEEMKTLWSEIEKAGKNVMSYSLNLIYENLDGVVSKL
jgi:hypothetical protein